MDSIDRKETLIEKYKFTIGELEEKLAASQGLLRRVTEEADQMRGYKHDCQRKDSLVKDYKAKMERMKQSQEEAVKEAAKNKSDLTKLKSDKIRLETQLDIKERELTTLRGKYEKLIAERHE